MVKVIAFFKRKPGLSVEDFHKYWRTTHPTSSSNFRASLLTPIVYAGIWLSQRGTGL